jgi:hypothetical protein
MTAKIVPNLTQPVVLKPLTRQPLLQHWQDELDFLESEVDFYCQLLKMGILNGRDASKPKFYALLEDFSKYRDAYLPGLRSTLDLQGMKMEEKRESVMSAIDKLEDCTVALRKLKSAVFPHLKEIQTFTIW